MKADFEPPKLSAWPFIVTDLVLVGTAGLIAWQASSQMSAAVVWSITLLVVVGAVVLMIPLLVNYSRRSDVALAERQKEIAALAETTAASAEQLSVAVAGLNHVVDSANRASKHADTLPQRLQERVNDFKEQLNEIAINENEALSQELSALRASELERLQTYGDRLQRLLAEMSQLEERLSGDRSAQEKMIASFRTEVKEGIDTFRIEVSSAQTALVDAEEAVRAALAETVDRIKKLGDEVQRARGRVVMGTGHDEGTGPHNDNPPSTPTGLTPDAPKADDPDHQQSNGQTGDLSPKSHDQSHDLSPLSGSPPARASQPEVRLDDQADDLSPQTELSPPHLHSSPGSQSAQPVPPPAPRKSRRRDDESQGGLDLGDFEQALVDEPLKSISADGATRLVVTAYIGIGNKLHVRGTGPGMSPEKGSPLQFVSIGKWRWESKEADGPFTFQLYKNDLSPALNLPPLTIEPGQQIEVRANF